jgi:predicted nucleotidyltransferase
MAEKCSTELAIEIASRYSDVLKEHINVDKLILFGSFAKNLQHQDSDIDIAVVSPDFTGDRVADQLSLMRYRRKVDLRIEPVPFRPQDFIASNPFAKEIMDTGQVIIST